MWFENTRARARAPARTHSTFENCDAYMLLRYIIQYHVLRLPPEAVLTNTDKQLHLRQQWFWEVIIIFLRLVPN